MNDLAASAIVLLNAVANILGRVFFAPIAYLPGWLSATLVAAATAVMMLLLFKYTSNQTKIKNIKRSIKANLLAQKLFKDSARVAIHSIAGVFVGALRLASSALVPMLVMLMPMTLLLGQLSLWYEARPLRTGEEGVVTLRLRQGLAADKQSVALATSDAFEVIVGPVRVLSKDEYCWNIKAAKSGQHRLSFSVAGETIEKDLAIGDGFMPVSVRRPAWHWVDVLLYPRESAFKAESSVQSIDVQYPTRESKTSGTWWWMLYWFGASMVFAIFLRKPLNVNI